MNDALDSGGAKQPRFIIIWLLPMGSFQTKLSSHLTFFATTDTMYVWLKEIMNNASYILLSLNRFSLFCRLGDAHKLQEAFEWAVGGEGFHTGSFVGSGRA